MLNCLIYFFIISNFSIFFYQINDAQKIYAYYIGKRFQFENCWVILKKKNPKWQYECASLTLSTPSTPNYISL